MTTCALTPPSDLPVTLSSPALTPPTFSRSTTTLVLTDTADLKAMKTRSSRPLVSKAPGVTAHSLRKHHRDVSTADSDDSSDEDEEGGRDEGGGRSSSSTGIIILVLVLLLCTASVLAVYYWHENRKGSSSSSAPVVKYTTAPGPSSPKPTSGTAQTVSERSTHASSFSNPRSGSTSKTIPSPTGATDESPPFSPTDKPKPTPSSRTTVDSKASPSPSSDKPSNSPASSSSSSSSSSVVSQELLDILLKTHNDFRALHQVPPLEWNETLAEASDRWVDHCVFEHSKGSLLEGGYGENLYMVSGAGSKEDDPVDGKRGVDSWNEEIELYTYDPPTGFTHETGHVTQTLWKDTKTVGCQFKNCKGVMKAGQWGSYLTCTYYPPGNYAGRFLENVLPPKEG